MIDNVPHRPFHLKVPSLTSQGLGYREDVSISEPPPPQSIPVGDFVTQHTMASRTRAGDLNTWVMDFCRRLFVGTGLSLFAGAITIMLLAPGQDPSSRDGSLSNESKSYKPPNDIKRHSPRIELTVSESDHDGQLPAEFDSSFVPEKQAKSRNVVNAVHFQESDSHQNLIRHAGHQSVRQTEQQPAWLTGEIEFSDSPSPMH